jgi:hypothetical protein
MYGLFHRYSLDANGFIIDKILIYLTMDTSYSLILYFKVKDVFSPIYLKNIQCNNSKLIRIDL